MRPCGSELAARSNFGLEALGPFEALSSCRLILSCSFAVSVGCTRVRPIAPHYVPSVTSSVTQDPLTLSGREGTVGLCVLTLLRTRVQRKPGASARAWVGLVASAGRSRTGRERV